jgi:hypothetical protein
MPIRRRWGTVCRSYARALPRRKLFGSGWSRLPSDTCRVSGQPDWVPLFTSNSVAFLGPVGWMQVRNDGNHMTVFDPQDADRLTRAFDRSWRALGFAFDDPGSRKAKAVRNLLAHQIVELAHEGERDPKRLSNAALASLPPYRSHQFTH